MDSNTQNPIETAAQNPVLVHKKACKNCFKLHRKCNKQMPCDYCSLRGKPCEINPCIKKRGRPLGSTNKNKANKEEKAAEKKKSGKPAAKKIKMEDDECQDHNHAHAHVAVRPFVDDNFTFDDSIVIQGVHTEIPQDVQPIKTCTICSSSVIESAKFCTNCGISMIDSQNTEMHSKLDSLRWKNTILEQKLHRFSTSEGKKEGSSSSFPVAPYLASWDFANFDLPSLGSFVFNTNQQQSISAPAPVNNNQESPKPTFFDVTEPAIFLDSSNIGSEQMLNWAFTFEQTFKKEGQDDSGIFSNFHSSEFPVFRENFPKF